jgi:PhnB protein
MALRTVTHLNFQGNARAALAFYHEVLKGQQTLVTYAQAGQADAARDPEDIIWGQVTGEDGIALMAYDVQAILPLWNALSAGAEVLQAPTASQWSPLYGMLRDRFGVTWVVDVVTPTRQA